MSDGWRAEEGVLGNDLAGVVSQLVILCEGDDGDGAWKKLQEECTSASEPIMETAATKNQAA